MIINRHQNWVALLYAFIEQRKSMGFAWGQNDCCMFAADAVLAMTGVDYAANFRGKYTTKVGAARALRRYGAGTIQATLTELLGAPVSRLNLRRGDVVLGSLNGQPTAGILLQHPVAPSDDTLAHFNASDIICGWRIG
jgi:hypothetical protein